MRMPATSSRAPRMPHTMPSTMPSVLLLPARAHQHWDPMLTAHKVRGAVLTLRVCAEPQLRQSGLAGQRLAHAAGVVRQANGFCQPNHAARNADASDEGSSLWLAHL